jgi:hypothetical protein
MREHVYYCNRDGCDSHQTSTAAAPITGWLLVVERAPSREPEQLDFCSWDCLMQYAATIPPPETIELRDV